MHSLAAKSKIRLLLLLDNKANRLACKHALSLHQDCVFLIYEAETGNQGLKIARTHHPDCILLGQHLPDMQGAEFLSELAEYSPELTLPVVILSSPNTRVTQEFHAGSFLMTVSDNNDMKGLSDEILWAMREQQAIQEKSKALHKLRESEAKYLNLVEQLPVITYVTSLETPGKLLYVSPQISKLGYLAEEWLENPNGLLKHVHQDDLAITIEAYAHTYEHNAPLRCEYRLMDNNGKTRWFLDQANVVRDESGTSLYLQGVLVDISKDKEIEQELFYYRQRLEEMVLRRTEQLETQCLILKTANANLDKALSEHRQTNARLRQSETRFRMLLESASEGILSIDNQGHCNFVNQSALNMLGYSRDEILGENIQFMMGRTDALDECGFSNPLGESLIQSSIEIFSRKDGSCFQVECSSYPIEMDGLSNSSVIVFRDVTASQTQIRNLAYRASHDPLTGLINRSEFERRLVRVLNSTHSDENEHVLCFLDIDHFKDVNDAFGHAAGDYVLSSFSRLLTSKLRQRDTLARLGGDEFVLLLEHTALGQAYIIANELCACVNNMRLTWQNREFSVSVSIGMSSLAQSHGDFTNVLCHADSACYEAKKKGRNQIHAFNYHHNYLPPTALSS